MNKLDEVMKIADIHVSRIELSLFKLREIFPLDENKILNFSEEEMLLVELLISRFSKLQDYIGRILINFLLKYTGDHEDQMTMIDKINKLERMKIIKNADTWEEMRQARNHIAHEYPDQPALTAKYLNQIFDLTPELINILNKIKSLCYKLKGKSQ